MNKYSFIIRNILSITKLKVLIILLLALYEPIFAQNDESFLNLSKKEIFLTNEEIKNDFDIIINQSVNKLVRFQYTNEIQNNCSDSERLITKNNTVLISIFFGYLDQSITNNTINEVARSYDKALFQSYLDRLIKPCLFKDEVICGFKIYERQCKKASIPSGAIHKGPHA